MTEAGSPVIRPFDPARDFGTVAAFLREVNLEDGMEWLPSEEVLRGEWAPSPRFEPARDAFVAETAEALVSVANTDWRARGASVIHDVRPVVAPAWRHRGLGRALLERLEARAGEIAAATGDGRPHILGAEFETQIPGVAEFAAAAGYVPHTYGFVLRRSLAEPVEGPVMPPGLEIRPVRPGDHRAIWDADTEAFLDDPEPAERDEADFVSWFAQPGIDTSLWRVAWAGDDVAGSVMTFVWADENERLGVRRAWLEHVSVRRPWRRRGLASALIAETLRSVAAEGFDDAALGVHGENPTGALGLYASLGFRVHRRWQLWRKPM